MYNYRIRTVFSDITISKKKRMRSVIFYSDIGIYVNMQLQYVKTKMSALHYKTEILKKYVG
jgi:hypothetical protein